MGSRALKRWDLKFALVTLACLFGTVAAGRALWQDINESGARGQGPAMAKVIRKEARVKRKAKASYVWSSVQLNESLYKKDSIQTSLESAAAIELKDGSILEMGENSLVVIDEVGDLSLNFLRGQMVLHTSSGDSRVSVGKDGKARIEQIPVRLVRPAPLAEILTSGNNALEIGFGWEPRANAQGAAAPERYTLQLSRDSKFRDSSTRALQMPDARTLAANVRLEPGRYYWRVLGRSAQTGQDEVLTQASQFRITSVEPLRPTWPSVTQRVRSFGREGNLQFRWLTPKGMESLYSEASNSTHRIVVSRDPAFRQIVLQHDIAPATGVATVKGLAGGTWHWRIQSQLGRLPLASQTERFELDVIESVPLELTYPETNAAFPLARALRFSWTSESVDAEYYWELENQAGVPVLALRSKALSAEWKKPEPGVYRWRVSAYINSQRMAQSAWRQFSVFGGSTLALLKPAKDQKILFWEQPAHVDLEWTQDELLTRDAGLQYRLELASDPEFKSIVTQLHTRNAKVSSTQLDLARKTDPTTRHSIFHWRVLVVDSNGQILKKTEASRFAYGVHPPLRAPAAAKPEPGSTINLVQHDGDPILSWAPVEGAQTYEVLIQQRDPKTRREKTVLQTVTPKSAVALKGIKEGSYSWSVRPVDQIQRRGEPLPARDLIVTYGQPLPAPEPITPEVQ